MSSPFITVTSLIFKVPIYLISKVSTADISVCLFDKVIATLRIRIYFPRYLQTLVRQKICKINPHRLFLVGDAMSVYKYALNFELHLVSKIQIHQ